MLPVLFENRNFALPVFEKISFVLLFYLFMTGHPLMPFYVRLMVGKIDTAV